MTRNDQKLVRVAHTRHGRRKHGVSLCEGLRCCKELLTRRPEWLVRVVCSRVFAESADFVHVAAMAEPTGKPLDIVEQREFAELACTENPQGVLCLIQPAPEAPADVPTDPFVLVLDRVGEPGNLGTILRTAWAVGLSEVWMTRGTVDPFAPKSVRAGMGAQFALALRTFADLPSAAAALAAARYDRLWLTVPSQGVDCFSDEFRIERSGLVIGNEATGVSTAPGALRVTIPMPGSAESLNAAQAATVFLFEAVRRGLMFGARQ